ncbi:hypothetical protein Q5P01_006208 [Channa striata]|uniref:Uncharacterized protein n=1 Tax=Channa striata TaxID=64152 RepID=A0AA88SWT5_CHASR|nr:hypothetical protein Q5P01_006208 [Channa striata]
MERLTMTQRRKKGPPAECRLNTSFSAILKIGLSWLKEGLSGGGDDAALLSISLCVQLLLSPVAVISELRGIISSPQLLWPFQP